MLHSFEWEDAAEAFQEAQRIEPEFAMAYWGEALSHTTGHHFPSGQNLPAAREILSRLGPTPEARAVKAPTAREKAYLAAIEDTVRARRRRNARARVCRRDASDLRRPSGRSGSRGVLLVVADADRAPREDSIRQDMQAGAIAQAVLRKNVDHPGAAHYAIHAYDESGACADRPPRGVDLRRDLRQPRCTRCTCRRTSSCNRACGTTSADRTKRRGTPP